MLPTQQITPDWLLAVLRRRFWLLLVPALFALLFGAIYAQLEPNRYRSMAVIQVTPPQLPENVVRPMVTMALRERLPMLEQEVLSRARLERIILDFGLYTKERAEGTMEDVVTAMRRDINVSLPRNTSRKTDGLSFTLAYSSLEPRTAFRVTERLVSLFVDENARQREVIAEGNDQFLMAELESARLRLQETEKRLEAYKKQFGGQLPDQMQTNLSALQGLQAQVQSLTEAIDRDRGEILVVQRELSDLTGASPGGVEVVEAAPIATAYDEALGKARATLEALELRLTADHPDVVRQRRVVADLEAKVADQQLRRPVGGGAPASSAQARVSQTELARRNRITELRRREQLLNSQIANRQRELQTRQAQASGYQARLDAAPQREAEMIGLVRDYETLKLRYTTLLQRSEEAKVAANMERRQVSEQFRITEPPRVPEQPYSPNRQRLTLMGGAIGLGLAVLLVGILEYRDSTFRTEQELIEALSLPVVAIVPTLYTAAERDARRQRMWMLSGGALTVFLVGAAVLFWAMRR